MRRALWAIALLFTVTPLAQAQPGILTREQLIEYTPDWKGERFPDGRPKVPDAIDARWTDAIEADFTAWLRQNIDNLSVGRAQIEEILKQR